MAFQDYIATEIATDAVDGIISRREALRRLALVGVSAGAAGALLAACGDDDGDDEAGPAQTTGTTAASTTSPTAATNLVTFPGPRGDLTASFAAAPTPKGAVLIIHENRGLTDHFVALPARLADAGYTALAPDLLSEEGGTASLTDEGAAQAALSAAPEERLVADLTAGIDELEQRAPGARIGAMGFCFGGGMTWSLLDAPEPRLAAAIPFYGPLPEGADFAGANAAVLAVYAGLDDRVNASRDAAGAALQEAGLTHEVKTFPDVDHAFFNDTGARYDQAAAEEAYRDVLDWFGQHLA